MASNNKVSFISKRWQKFLFIVSPALLIIAFNFIVISPKQKSRGPKYLYDTLNTILVLDTCSRANSSNMLSDEKRIKNPEMFLSYLQNNYTIEKELNMSRVNVLWQIRIAFLGLVVLLLTIVLSRKRKDTRKILRIILGFILLVFLLDVQLNDEMNKSTFIVNSAIVKPIKLLMHTMHDDNLIYIYNENELEVELKEYSELKQRWCRKIQLACMADMGRIVIYLIPWIFIAYTLSGTIKRPKKPNNKKNT